MPRPTELTIAIDKYIAEHPEGSTSLAITEHVLNCGLIPAGAAVRLRRKLRDRNASRRLGGDTSHVHHLPRSLSWEIAVGARQFVNEALTSGRRGGHLRKDNGLWFLVREGDTARLRRARS